MLSKIFKVGIFAVFSALFIISCGSTPEGKSEGQSVEEKASSSGENSGSEDVGLAPNSEVMKAIADAETARDAAKEAGADKSRSDEFTALSEALELLKGKDKKTNEDVMVLRKITDAFKALKSYTKAEKFKEEVDSKGWQNKDEATYKKGEDSLKEVDKMLTEMNPDDLDSAKEASEMAESSFAKILRDANAAAEADLSKRVEAAKAAAEAARGEAVAKGLDKKRAKDFSNIDSRFQSLKSSDEKNEKLIEDFNSVEKEFKALVADEDKAAAEAAKKKAADEKAKADALKASEAKKAAAEAALAKEIAAASKAAEDAKAAAKTLGLDKTRKDEFQAADSALNKAKSNKAKDKTAVSAFKAAEGKFKALLKSECDAAASVASKAKSDASWAASNGQLKTDYAKASKMFDDAAKAASKGDYAKAINLYKCATELFNSLGEKLGSQKDELEVSIKEAREAVKYSHDYALEADKKKPLSGDSVKGILKKGEKAIKTDNREKR